MDGTTGQAHDPLVPLRQAIRDNMEGWTQSDLARAVGLDGGQLSRLLNGTSDAFTLDLIARIEDALGLGRGDLLRAAGYVEPATIKSAVTSDPSLSAEHRRLLRELLRSWGAW